MVDKCILKVQNNYLPVNKWHKKLKLIKQIKEIYIKIKFKLIKVIKNRLDKDMEWLNLELILIGIINELLRI